MHSSTDCLIDNRPSGCWYLGVDIKDDGRRDHIHQPEVKRWFVHENSTSFISVRMAFEYRQVDLLFIDGRHSVRQVLLDMRFAEKIRPGGVVLLHDINYHPGPRLVFDAVDPDLFDKSSVCPHADDFGLGLLRRK